MIPTKNVNKICVFEKKGTIIGFCSRWNAEEDFYRTREQGFLGGERFVEEIQSKVDGGNKGGSESFSILRRHPKLGSTNNKGPGPFESR